MHLGGSKTGSPILLLRGIWSCNRVCSLPTASSLRLRLLRIALALLVKAWILPGSGGLHFVISAVLLRRSRPIW